MNSSYNDLRSKIAAASLPDEFYYQPTLDVAQQLLGKLFLVINEDSEISKEKFVSGQSDPQTLLPDYLVGGFIVETEGYVAKIDPACHAYHSRTSRNDVMWGAGGHAYIYFSYGNHWMLNIVTEQSGIAAAVLIRALEPAIGITKMRERRNLHLLKTTQSVDRNLTNGPGKLCQALGINKLQNGSSFRGPKLYICDPEKFGELSLVKPFPSFEMVTTTRIGITKAVDFPWRFYVKGNKYVSHL